MRCKTCASKIKCPIAFDKVDGCSFYWPREYTLKPSKNYWNQLQKIANERKKNVSNERI